MSTMRPPHILSIGYDRRLMAVRSMVLRQAGFSVDEVYCAQGAMNWIQCDVVDLVLICHSVPPGEQQKLIVAFRKQRRLIPILCITAYDAAGEKECINVENSPITLLDAIKSATAWS